MTLRMADSIDPSHLPGGYEAYLGYVDGRWPDFQAEVRRFPGAHVVGLTVRGGGGNADGCDIENGDLSPASGVAWAASRLASRPILYASVSTMGDVLGELAAHGIPRTAVRLLSAHYGHGQHICGPATCGLVKVAMDGTQWTDNAPGAGGAPIDASLLEDGFFGAAPAAQTWMETMMRALPTIRQGASGADVRTLQGLLEARGYRIGIDGTFGPATDTVLRRFQADHHLSADGIAGQQTWTAAVGG